MMAAEMRIVLETRAAFWHWQSATEIPMKDVCLQSVKKGLLKSLDALNSL